MPVIFRLRALLFLVLSLLLTFGLVSCGTTSTDSSTGSSQTESSESTDDDNSSDEQADEDTSSSPTTGAANSTIAAIPEFEVTLPDSLAADSASPESARLRAAAVTSGTEFDAESYSGVKSDAWYAAVEAAKAPQLAQFVLDALEVIASQTDLIPGSTLDLTSVDNVSYGTANLGYLAVSGTDSNPALYWTMPLSLSESETSTLWLRVDVSVDDDDMYVVTIDLDSDMGFKSFVRYDQGEDETFLFEACDLSSIPEPSMYCYADRTTLTSAYRPGREGSDISLLSYERSTMGYNDVENRVYQIRRVVWGNDDYGGGLSRTIFDDEGSPDVEDASSYFGENRSVEFYDDTGTVVWTKGTRASPTVGAVSYTDIESRIDVPLNQVSFDSDALGSLFIIPQDEEVEENTFGMYFQKGDDAATRVNLSRTDIGYGTLIRYDPINEVIERLFTPSLARYDFAKPITLEQWLSEGKPEQFTLEVSPTDIDRFENLESYMSTTLRDLSIEAPYLPIEALPFPAWTPDELDDISELEVFEQIADRALPPTGDGTTSD